MLHPGTHKAPPSIISGRPVRGGERWVASIGRSTTRDEDLTTFEWGSGSQRVQLWWGPHVAIEQGDIVTGFPTHLGFNIESIASKELDRGRAASGSGDEKGIEPVRGEDRPAGEVATGQEACEPARPRPSSSSDRARRDPADVEVTNETAFWIAASAELARSRVIHPPEFRSLHEGYAVLREEVDELWDIVRQQDGARSREELEHECVQIAAMAAKIVLSGQ